MAISKKVFDALRTANVPDDIIKDIETENGNLVKFEGDDRHLEKIKKQLGDNKLEDLLSAKATLDSFGGADKVKELELSLAKTESEKQEILKKHELSAKEIADIKANAETISKQLTSERLKNALLPHLDVFVDKSRSRIVKELIDDGRVFYDEAGNIKVKNGSDIVDFQKGFEAIKSDFDYNLVRDTSPIQSTNTPPQNNPLSTERVLPKMFD